ncbi:hypothetical protein BD779DRAFT_1541717, partial [Infundibulicybe gibba]
MSSTASPECPILVWMLSLNRDYTKEVSKFTLYYNHSPNRSSKEYDACYRVVKACVPHVNPDYKPYNPDSFRTCF